MTIQQANQSALVQLRKLYEEREAANITDWVMEHITGKKRIDRLMNKEAALDNLQEKLLTGILQQLSAHKPVQYVLAEAWFGGLSFYVNEHVLIPRPETEELVEWILAEIQPSKVKSQKKIIDVGTGSGCIPVTLAVKSPALSITAIDLSEDALIVARKNAATHQADITCKQLNFLDESLWYELPVFDLIVSNPPYIRQSEEKDMSENVLAYEPSLALFVPDEDALLFYRKIALFAKTHLAAGGNIFLEINEALGNEVVALYQNHGYQVALKKDLQGKDRMVKASLENNLA